MTANKGIYPIIPEPLNFDGGKLAREKWVYKERGMKLLHGDCLELMKDLEHQSIDLILCDLPYGTTSCKWDTIIPLDVLWIQYKRIIKDNGVIVLTASQPFATDLINSNRGQFKYEWIWEKTMPSGIGNANKRPMKYHENILIFYKKQPIYNKTLKERSDIGKERLKNNGKILNGIKAGNHIKKSILVGTYSKYDINFVNPSSILRFGSVPNCNGTKLHPTQKPVSLFEYLIKTYTNEGDLVLDNCMGSGTTGVACKNLNREFIGIEMDDKYFEIAKKRIENHQPQLSANLESF